MALNIDDKKTGWPRINVRIPMGLPGSGKTTFYKSMADKDRHHITYIDVDSIVADKKNHLHQKLTFLDSGQSGHNRRYLVDLEKLFLWYNVLPNDTVLLDMLCLDSDIVMCYLRQLSALSGSFNRYQADYHIIIDIWRENREQCLINDSLRDEERRCQVTIQNADFKPMTVDVLNDMVKSENLILGSVTIENHDVAVAEEYQIKLCLKGSPADVRYLRSESWSLGGTCADYTGTVRHIEAEPQKDYSFIDEFIEKIAPEITFIQYKKLIKECVTLEETEESDYYGGVMRYACWKTDLKRLYTILKEDFKLIK